MKTSAVNVLTPACWRLVWTRDNSNNFNIMLLLLLWLLLLLYVGIAEYSTVVVYGCCFWWQWCGSFLKCIFDAVSINWDDWLIDCVKGSTTMIDCVEWSTNQLIDWLIDCVEWSTYWLVDWLSDQLIDWLIWKSREGLYSTLHLTSKIWNKKQLWRAKIIYT